MPNGTPFDALGQSVSQLATNLVNLPVQLLQGLTGGVSSAASNVQFPLTQILTAPLQGLNGILLSLNIQPPFQGMPGGGGGGAPPATGTFQPAAAPAAGGPRSLGQLLVA